MTNLMTNLFGTKNGVEKSLPNGDKLSVCAEGESTQKTGVNRGHFYLIGEPIFIGKRGDAPDARKDRHYCQKETATIASNDPKENRDEANP